MRYKEFNRNKILEDCISLFWKQSYTGTSISDIVKATNVNLYSLYNEFKNKRGILDASIQRELMPLKNIRFLSKRTYAL
jgi:AcrR family transcriptional regulator